MSDDKNKQQKDDEKPRTFTQDEVEAMIRGRLAKFSDYDDIKAELEKVKAETQSDQEKALEAARKEAREEVMGDANRRLINAEARALAAETGWHYPQDAHRYIDASTVKVNDDGTIDAESVKNALAKATEDRPALLKTAEDNVPPADNAGIGVHGAPRPKTITDAWAADIGARKV